MLKPIFASLIALASLSASAASNFHVVVPLKGKYDVPVVSDVVVTLHSAPAGALPAAMLGKSYSADLTSYLQITGDANLNFANATWSVTGLPAGLVSSGGIISGTPTQANEAGSQVSVSVGYKTKTGAQTYLVYVNSVALELSSIAMNRTHGCGITTSGAAKCWGSSAYGQLGTGIIYSTTTPVQVTGMTSVKSIATGHYHSCAVTTAGAAYCWGYTGMGQLGNGQAGSTSVPSPTLVTGLSTGVKSIAASGSTTCAVMETNTVKCWGYNNGGVIGNGTWDTYYATPQNVVGLTGATKVIVSNSSNACALLDTGAVKCWGSNSTGSNGDGTTTHRASPVSVVGLGGPVSDLANSAGYGLCAVMSSGTVKCWGSDYDGQLGNGAPEVNSTVPVDVTGLTGVKKVSVGESSACAITTVGDVYCWGNNTYGQLGQGSTSAAKYAPVKVQDTAPYADIVVSRHGTCGITVSGIGKCWGYNSAGQLGNGTSGNYQYLPAAIKP